MKRIHLHRRSPRRAGAILIIVAFALIALIAMAGLVLDGGQLMLAHRRAQNAADAGARAAALTLRQGGNLAAINAAAQDYVFVHNGVPHAAGVTPEAQALVATPPANGPYAGRANFVEVTVQHPFHTWFIHLVPGLLGGAVDPAARMVSARAVAGPRVLPLAAGVVVLDPQGDPGIAVGGANAILQVNTAGIIDFSLRQGEDQYGETVGSIAVGHPAFTVGGAGSQVRAEMVFVSGGVDDRDNFRAPAVGELHAGTYEPVFDPFHIEGSLVPVPTVANGVLNRNLGDVQVTNNNARGIMPPNTYDPNTGIAVLNPGIYDSIHITGGTVTLNPGIYVLRPAQGGGANTLILNGGFVTGQGVMFYNTGSDYDPLTGAPDTGDLLIPSTDIPPVAPATRFGGTTILASTISLKPIDTTLHDYTGMPGIEIFNQMLFYQRRADRETISVQDGAPAPNGLQGRIYAKWANLSLAGSGTYNAAILVGSINVNGQATINASEGLFVIPQLGRVRLVE